MLDMLDRITEWVLDTLDKIPILLGADPHNAALVRAVFALLLIAVFIYLMAMRPFRSVIGRLLGRHRNDEK
jgi:hypothetical protein